MEAHRWIFLLVVIFLPRICLAQFELDDEKVEKLESRREFESRWNQTYQKSLGRKDFDAQKAAQKIQNNVNRYLNARTQDSLQGRQMKAPVVAALRQESFGTQAIFVLFRDDMMHNEFRDPEDYYEAREFFNRLDHFLKGRPEAIGESNSKYANEMVEWGDLALGTFFRTNKGKKLIGKLFQRMPKKLKDHIGETVLPFLFKKGATAAIDQLADDPESMRRFMTVLHQYVNDNMTEVYEDYNQSSAFQMFGQMMNLDIDPNSNSLESVAVQLEKVLGMQGIGELGGVAETQARQLLIEFDRTGVLDLDALEGPLGDLTKSAVEKLVKGEDLPALLEQRKMRSKLERVQAISNLGNSLGRLGEVVAGITGNKTMSRVFQGATQLFSQALDLYQLAIQAGGNVSMFSSMGMNMMAGMVNIYAFALNFAFSMMSGPDPTLELLQDILEEVRGLRRVTIQNFEDVKQMLQVVMQSTRRIEAQNEEIKLMLVDIQSSIGEVLERTNLLLAIEDEDSYREFANASRRIVENTPIVISHLASLKPGELPLILMDKSTTYEELSIELQKFADELTIIFDSESSHNDSTPVTDRGRMKLRAICYGSGGKDKDCEASVLFPKDKSGRAFTRALKERLLTTPISGGRYLSHLENNNRRYAAIYGQGSAQFKQFIAAGLCALAQNPKLNLNLADNERALRIRAPQDEYCTAVDAFDSSSLMLSGVLTAEEHLMLPAFLDHILGNPGQLGAIRNGITDFTNEMADYRRQLVQEPWTYGDPNLNSNKQRYLDQLIFATENPVDVDRLAKRLPWMSRALPFIYQLAALRYKSENTETIYHPEVAKELPGLLVVRKANQVLEIISKHDERIRAINASLNAFEGIETPSILHAEGSRVLAGLRTTIENVSGRVLWQSLSSNTRDYLQSLRNDSPYFYLHQIWPMVQRSNEGLETTMQNAQKDSVKPAQEAKNKAEDRVSQKLRQRRSFGSYMDDDPRNTAKNSKAWRINRHVFKWFSLASSYEDMEFENSFAIIMPRSEDLNFYANQVAYDRAETKPAQVFLAFHEDDSFLKFFADKVSYFDERGRAYMGPLSLPQEFEDIPPMAIASALVFELNRGEVFDPQTLPLKLPMPKRPIGNSGSLRDAKPEELTDAENKKIENWKQEVVSYRERFKNAIGFFRPQFVQAYRYHEALNSSLLSGSPAPEKIGELLSKSPHEEDQDYPKDDPDRSIHPANGSRAHPERLVIFMMREKGSWDAQINMGQQTQQSPPQPDPDPWPFPSPTEASKPPRDLRAGYLGQDLLKLWLEESVRAEHYLRSEVSKEVSEVFNRPRDAFSAEDVAMNYQNSIAGQAYNDYKDWYRLLNDIYVDLETPVGPSPQHKELAHRLKRIEDKIKALSPEKIVAIDSLSFSLSSAEKLDAKSLDVSQIGILSREWTAKKLELLDEVEAELLSLGLEYGAFSSRRDAFQVYLGDLKKWAVAYNALIEPSRNHSPLIEGMGDSEELRELVIDSWLAGLEGASR